MKNTRDKLIVCAAAVMLSAFAFAGCGTPADAENQAVTKEDILSGVADEGTYLLKAMHAGFTDAGETIFETIDGDIIVPGKYNPDNVYMLTMYMNGTEDKADDEVSVVWGTCVPEE